MYVRVRRIEVKAGAQEEVRTIWRDRIIPNLQQQTGFNHIYVTQNRLANQIFIVFLWESKSDAEAWVNQASTQQLLAPLGPLTASPPVTEEYELMAEG